jgi:glycosyltransferase involved in cell wall biosynthesis
MLDNQHIKVLMFGWELPPDNSGGLGVACLGLTKGLASQGVRVSFALPRPLSTSVLFMDILPQIIDGVDFTAINSHIRAYMTNKDYCDYYERHHQTDTSLYGNSLYEEAMHFAELGAIWSKSKPHDIIHAHDWMTYPAGISARSVSGKPLVLHVHATEFDRTGSNCDPRISEIEYQGLTAADSVIAVSDYTRHIVHDKYNIPLEKISIVHNGVDQQEFSANDVRRIFPHDKIVLYVGRLTFQKGVEYFLRSAKEVLTSEPNTVFIIAGTGDMERRLIIESAHLGIGNRVIFTGFMQGSKLQTLYQMADVFVMPSVSEPYGLVALEAVSTGIPTIISKQSGVSETLTAVSKVNFWDTHHMAQEVISVLHFPQLARERAKTATFESRKITWDLAATKTINLYQSLIGQ